jgi:putative hemolysin
MLAVNLLNEMKRRRLQFAVVVDELGAVSGIVTLEDLVEELIGEIFSEHDAPPPEAIRREADDTYLVEAGMPLHEVNRGLDLDLPLSERWSTLAGLCLDLAGRIPAVGDRIDAPGAVLEVVSASPRQVLAVRVHRRPPPPADGDAGGGESSTEKG